MSTENTLPKNILVRLKSSGGLLPIEREWLYYSDGRIQHPNGKITKIKKKLIHLLLNPNRLNQLDKLPPDFSPPLGSADFILMELTFRSALNIKKITIADSNESVPKELWDFWSELQNTAITSLKESE